ncbi:hypothetical protein, partial [Xylella fastidiosa]|uniref:hypothetical protein n=1 Tax=Xylella fastidiosa TaxID=2371 RepID=UPI0028804B73
MRLFPAAPSKARTRWGNTETNSSKPDTGVALAVALQGPVTERTGALDTAQQSRKTGQRLRRGDGTVCRMGWP